jgi:hypothetical protein
VRLLELDGRRRGHGGAVHGEESRWPRLGELREGRWLTAMGEELPARGQGGEQGRGASRHGAGRELAANVPTAVKARAGALGV